MESTMKCTRECESAGYRGKKPPLLCTRWGGQRPHVLPEGIVTLVAPSPEDEWLPADEE
jgi:hypothetical protein